MLTLGPELASQEVVAAMREDHAVFAVKIVDDFHVELAGLRVTNRRFNAREFVDGGLDENELRTEVRLVKPVSSRHGDGTRRQEEQFIHELQDRGIRVER